mmetsp:Transcript_14162/g.21512  ORF Transcript_14162/g.21512 Transcript_14162/m.21512 type:complete len:465 (+) Transcript_14162:137-1531(+)
MDDLGYRYWGSFIILAVLTLGLQYHARTLASKKEERNSSKEKASNSSFRTFQLNYLGIFLLAMLSDWLQGPYVYALYSSYGFSQEEIAQLFVCGFGSSMIVGTFVGGLADKFGRKKMCMLYCLCYILSCLTKLVPEYWTLMVGRFLGGVATSLLFSVFEAWMVSEHNRKGFDGALIGDTFSYATFGNGLVAVLAGLVANAAAESHGYVAPFMLSIVPLVLILGAMAVSWEENYGDQAFELTTSMAKGLRLLREDKRIFALGLGQSCFEGAMYTFVFMWTPALQEAPSSQEGKTTEDYLGLIFAAFMVAVMAGSSLFKILLDNPRRLVAVPLGVHAAAAASMGLAAMAMDADKGLVYTLFLVFEAAVGLFYPAYGMIKAEALPENIRSAVMNMFRVPLNLFVVFVLLKIEHLSSRAVFGVCALTHLLGLLAYAYFFLTRPPQEKVRQSPAVREGDREKLLEGQEL